MGERRPLPNALSDYYTEARSISEVLKIEGQRQWGNLLIEKIEAGSSATEILMGLWWVLQECLNTRGSRLGDIEKRMLRLVSKIDGALK